MNLYNTTLLFLKVEAWGGGGAKKTQQQMTAPFYANLSTLRHSE